MLTKPKEGKVFVTIDHRDDKLIIGDCLYRYFPSKPGLRPIVNFYYDQNTGKTSLCNFYNDELPSNAAYTYGLKQLTFGHAGTCPSLELNKIKNCLFEKHKNFIGAACCGIVMDKSGKVLITKRSSLLRSFPGAWVFPGGKIDFKESIEDAVLREIYEETGLSVAVTDLNSVPMEEETSKKSWRVKATSFDPFFVWESVYPSSLKIGLPQYQMIIIFFYIRINKNCEEIVIKLQEQEVERAMWISIDKLYDVLTIADIKHSIFNENVKTFYPQNDYADLNLLNIKDVYPNQFGEGLGEAHKEAIKFFFEKNKKKF